MKAGRAPASADSATGMLRALSRSLLTPVRWRHDLSGGRNFHRMFVVGSPSATGFFNACRRVDG
jgi:hypothetical protein